MISMKDIRALTRRIAAVSVRLAKTGYAVLSAGFLILTGCLPILTTTPHTALFRLDPRKDDPRETLVIAGYRDGDEIWNGTGRNEPFSYRLIRPKNDDSYAVPAIWNWELVGWDYVPINRRQYRPLLIVVSADGRVAVLDDEPELSAAFPVDQVSSLVPDNPGALQRLPAAAKSLDANAIMGYLACEILRRHDPEGLHPKVFITPQTAIRAEDAVAMNEFVRRHPATFGPITVALWERLDRHFGQSAQLSEEESGNWQEMGQRFIGKSPVPMKNLIGELPERERALLPVNPAQVIE